MSLKENSKKVKLVSLTKPVGELSNIESQDLVAYIARVSNPSNQMNLETAPKLLSYLIKNKHWSPLEHVSMGVQITTSRAIAAQILRHRSMVFQEFSQRYQQVSSFVKYPARRQDIKNRQNSIDDMSAIDKEWFDHAQDEVWNFSFQKYQEALQKGVAKEQARMVLPLNTETTMYMTGNLRSWLHYIELRSANGTQLEHMEIALEIKAIFCEQFPDIGKAMGWMSDELPSS